MEGAEETAVEFWCMMGGLLGFVGLGRVRGSQKTIRRGAPCLLPPDPADNMDDWETPVEGARSINDAADGVAVWKIGRLMLSGGLGLPDTPGTWGRVDDLGRVLPPEEGSPSLLAEGGRVDVFRLGMVTVPLTLGLSSAFFGCSLSALPLSLMSLL